MRLLKRCEDPLIVAVRETYNANPIRMPRADITPLCVVASNKTHSDFLGRLQPLLVGTRPIDVPLKTAPTAQALSEKSRSVSVDVGLNLLGGFLAAWGIPSADLDAKFHGTTKVSFRFDHAARLFVDSTDLSAAIADRTINVNNPLVTNFFGENAFGFFVIDATLTSRSFTMRVEEAESDKFSLAVPAIQDFVGKAHAGITVDSKDAREVTFEGNRDMPFAFSCLRFNIDDQGKIESIELHKEIPSFGFNYGGAPSSLKRVLLADEPGLLDFN